MITYFANWTLFFEFREIESILFIDLSYALIDFINFLYWFIYSYVQKNKRCEKKCYVTNVEANFK